MVDRIALRDQPILNKFQGEIFRLPLDRQVLLFGPPGSGKTTTLIKRLAQKRTPDALTEVESILVADLARDDAAALDSWTMFSPAELLKQYLGSAFIKKVCRIPAMCGPRTRNATTSRETFSTPCGPTTPAGFNGRRQPVR